jgi:hypothetical protein
MRVIIVGSRSINNIALVELACYQAIQRWKRNNIVDYITEITCGESNGVDLLAKILAAKAKIPIKIINAEHENEMFNSAEALIAVWDGRSPGTKLMIDAAKKKKLKVFVFQLNSGETVNETST